MPASEIPTWFVRVFAFAFGAIWGSFANVLIYRWPRELSVVKPPSHCFACKTPIAPYDNVPIFAYLWLRGRCRHCGAKFSPRYAIVELIFAVVSTAIAERVFFHAAPLEPQMALLHYAVRFTVAFILLATTFIDLDEMIVPWFV
jgi:leader peptidase (prepilin peptidase)/N-methyltransferase